MFVRPDQYQSVVAIVVAEEPRLDVAVAFWGEGADVHIHPEISKPIRMIVNLRSGGTNPWMIKDLLRKARKNPHIEIQQCDRLHAKVIVGEANLVVGSANLSRNGLGLEGQELAHWLEAAIHTTMADEVHKAQQWFEQLWTSAETRAISNQDLSAALVAYERNRKARPDYSPKGPFTFTKYQPHELEVRDAYALIYNSRPCEEADEAGDRYHQQIVPEQEAEKGRKPSKHWNFESWPDALDTTERYEYLCLFLEEDGEVIVDGVCRMTGLRVPFEYRGEGAEGWVDLARPTSTLMGHSLKRAQRAALALELGPSISDVWAQAEELEEGARRIHLSEIARILATSHAGHAKVN